MKPVDPSTWRFGIPSDSIVRDAPEDGLAEASEPYYGGRLVAESMDVSEREFILRACKAHAGLMAAAQAAAVPTVEGDLSTFGIDPLGEEGGS